MSKAEGLKKKYHVKRVDGKPLKRGCIVLEFGDPMAWPALKVWADSMNEAGYVLVAHDVETQLFLAKKEREQSEGDCDVKEKT